MLHFDAMAKRIVLGGLAGAVIIFFWGFVTWALTGWRAGTFQRFGDEATVSQSIMSGANAAGVYLFPWGIAAPGEDEAKVQAAAMKQQEAVGFVFAVVAPKAKAEMGAPMALHVATQFLACMLVMWLLLKSKAQTFGERWQFVIAFGVAASIACYAPESVWWHYPAAWTIGGIGEITIGFALAGLAMARIAR